MSVYPSTVAVTSSTHEYIDGKVYSLPDCWVPVPPVDLRRGCEKKGICDKRTTMQEAVSRHITDDINLGMGGLHDTRGPVAIVHEIIRHGVRGLTLSLSSSSICAELLAGAMILDPGHLSIKRIDFAWHDDGHREMRPLLGYLVDAGMVECSDFSISNPGARFTVGACSSDLSGWQSLEDAGSAEELNVSERIGVHGLSGKRETAWSFCRPDVGIVHVPAADMCGNARIIGALCGCPDIARAAARTIMSVDQILPQEHICGYAGLTEISSDDIDEVVEQPFGATPGACRGHYGFDIAHLLEFRTLCEEFRKSGNTDRLQKYYDRNIFGCETFEDFLNLQSSHSLQEIIRKDGGQSLDLD